MTTWLITGCSTGLGRALAKAVLARGDNAVVTARDANAVKDITDPYPDTGLRLPLDMSDLDQIDDVHVHAEGRFGGIDVLINNAGHGHRSAVEEADDTEIAQLFATNFFGPVALIKTVLPSMRARRGGVIVNISSIAGRRSNPGSGYYAATKCALEAVSDALMEGSGTSRNPRHGDRTRRIPNRLLGPVTHRILPPDR